MSVEDVVSAIRKVQVHIKAHDRKTGGLYLRRAPANNHEASTRYILVDPILRSLGWDLSDPTHCIVEYDTRPGNGRNDGAKERFVDYALLDAKGYGVVMVEAKRIDHDTRNVGDRVQVGGYVKNVRTAKLAVLTTGEFWYIQVKKSRGRWEAESANALGLMWPNPEETAQRLYDALDRSKFVELEE